MDDDSSKTLIASVDPGVFLSPRFPSVCRKAVSYEYKKQSDKLFRCIENEICY